MKAKSIFFSALIASLAFVFAVPVLRAESVDEKIKAIEQELMQLRAEQEQVKEEQIELKKLATEAAAALPGFSYRPRSGLTITAADKSWQFNISSQFHVRLYNHTDGNDSHGAQSGKLFGRRITLFTDYCWQDCFYNFALQVDMDQNNIPLELQRAMIQINFDQLNPFLPNLRFGLDVPANKAHLVSSRNSARWERPGFNDNSGATVTGSHQGIGLVWDGVPVGISTIDLEGHLVTGRLGAGDSRTTNSDMMSFIGYAGIEPFDRSKNKWLRGLELRFGVELEPADDRGGVASDLGGLGGGIYRRMRLRTDERIGRFVIIDSGNNSIGGGLHHHLFPGLIYNVGPYTLNVAGGFSRWRGRNDGFRGIHMQGFEIAHELYLWSPKGFFTGRSTTPGSIQFGWSFERSDMDCGVGSDCAPGSGAFRRAHLIQRELNLWYTVIAGLRIGLQHNWWTSSNTPIGVQRATNCSSNTNATDVGKSCDWHTVNLTAALNW